MSSTIDCVIDTQPMANQIDKVSNHVKGTAAAVVTMQTAVIAAEKKASDHVCQQVNLGFYTMIRSQISQKMAKLQSDVDSHHMMLMQQKKQLLGIKSRMGRDYMMLYKRYNKLFSDLNKALHKRVYELDYPTVNFADNEMSKITNRGILLTATIPVGQEESVKQSQNIVASNVKYQSARVINVMKQFLIEHNKQRKLTSTILLSGQPRQGKLSLPVLVMESCGDKNGTKVDSVYVNSSDASASMQRSIKNQVASSAESLHWVDTAEKNKETTSEYSKLVESSKLPTRVKEMMTTLYNASSYQTLNM
ncbi:MAG: hypothetical protein K6D59_04905 [Bacteroidales bacterium]|nr:hypothetical protein [Bacteroidales bacterium]